MNKISVIVPIYNVEKYISRCIDSIINQTFKNLEIILVNDGSTDNSLSICKKYEKLDSRIVLIDKPNGGVSSARNAGIEISSGDFIGFVDPDDWIEPNMYENMYDKLNHTLGEIVMCNYYQDTKISSKKVELQLTEDVVKGNDILNKLLAPMISTNDLDSGKGTLMGSVWRMLINKKIIVDNNIKFREDIPLMEDLIFIVNVLLKSNIVLIDEGFHYHYMQYEVSTINKYRDNLKEIHDKVTLEIEKLLTEEKVYEVLKNNIDIRYGATRC